MNDIPIVEPYTFGRPREYNYIEWAQKLVKWAGEQGSINLNKFCASYGIPPQYLSKWASESEHFREAYNHAKAFIGARREEMLNAESLHVKAYDLNASVYDFFLKEEKRLQAELESELRKKEVVQVTPEQLEQLAQLTDQLASLRSERKDAASNINTDSKS